MICNLPDYQSVIVLNSHLDPKICAFLKKNIPILAADGATNHLIKANIQPHYIIGDEDSYQDNANIAAKRIKIEDQNFTDFEKAILFAKEHSLTPSLVLGINGGELDHILGNTIALLKHADHQNLYCLDSYLRGSETRFKLGVPLTKGSLSLLLPQKSLISIVAFENTILTTKGLRWELLHTLLHANGPLAIRNENTSPCVELTIEQGKALLLIDLSRDALQRLY